MRYFNPRTPCGVRRPSAKPSQRRSRFQSTHPLRGATALIRSGAFTEKIFQSTHPLRGATLCYRLDGKPARYFNPRTPCGVRRSARSTETRMDDFNPRTPCGVRPRRMCMRARCTKFQSTHPLRGATCAERSTTERMNISIHAPLAGCDYCHPCAGNPIGISIHAPLAGCDDTKLTVSAWQKGHFNPRTPCGVRLSTVSFLCSKAGFQSTHPLRGATAKTYKENCTFFELADKLSARIAAKKPSAKADRCA